MNVQHLLMSLEIFIATTREMSTYCSF